MIVFGPYEALPNPEEGFSVFNISSFNENIPRLPNLIVDIPEMVLHSDDMEKDFDMWYYDYIINKDPIAFGSMMTILMNLYNTNRVYVCISNFKDSFLNTINESFIKILQQRYGLRCVRVNVREDWDSMDMCGSDFTSYDGLDVFDYDRLRYIKLAKEGVVVPWNTQTSGIR